jgi:hypothetical protein
LPKRFRAACTSHGHQGEVSFIGRGGLVETTDESGDEFGVSSPDGKLQAGGPRPRIVEQVLHG